MCYEPVLHFANRKFYLRSCSRSVAIKRKESVARNGPDSLSQINLKTFVIEMCRTTGCGACPGEGDYPKKLMSTPAATAEPITPEMLELMQ